MLLCHRHPDREWYPNVWDVPGGHVEAGERRIDALVRELREELGIDIDADTAVSVFAHSPTPDLDVEFFAVAAWTGDVVNARPAEHDQIGWFSIEHLDYLVLADDGVATACRLAFGHVATRPADTDDEGRR